MSEDHSETAHPRLPEFRRRLAYIDRSFRNSKAVEEQAGAFNESLKILAKAVNPRARRSQVKARLHPYLEIAIATRWRKRWRQSGETEKRRPAPAEIFEICQELSKTIRPIRGRPANAILEFHVYALMALLNEMGGAMPRATPFKDSVYEPQLDSTGRIIEGFFQAIDPSITTTTLVNIVMKAHRTGAVTGKRFHDFCPLYGGDIDAETGWPIAGPGFKIVDFEPAYPIYCY